MSGTVLGVLSGAIVIGTWMRWFHLLNQVRIPRDRTSYLTLNGVGAMLGVAAFAAGTHFIGGILAGVAIVGGSVFLYLRSQSPQAAVTPAVSVGGPVLDFTAPDEEGRPFDLTRLRGKPFLLKFFRGHW